MHIDSAASPLGGEGEFVEADETFIGGKARNRAYRVPTSKKAVVSLVERKGRVRSHHVPEVNAANFRPILEAGINKASHLRTDESGVYSFESERPGAAFGMKPLCERCATHPPMLLYRWNSDAQLTHSAPLHEQDYPWQAL